MKNRLIIVVLVLAALVLGGVAFDRHRAKERHLAAVPEMAKKQKPPLPQHGQLLVAADSAEITGIAKCGYCYWNEGGKTCNTVLQMSQDPGIVFLLPNEKREELEQVTGKCAEGKFRVTARGTITQYDGHNYMLVKNFETSVVGN